MSREKRLRVAAKDRDAYSSEQWAALVAYDEAQSALERHLRLFNCLNLSDRGEHKTDAAARAEHVQLIEARDGFRAKAAATDPRNTR